MVVNIITSWTIGKCTLFKIVLFLTIAPLQIMQNHATYHVSIGEHNESTPTCYVVGQLKSVLFVINDLTIEV